MARLSLKKRWVLKIFKPKEYAKQKEERVKFLVNEYKEWGQIFNPTCLFVGEKFGHKVQVKYEKFLSNKYDVPKYVIRGNLLLKFDLSLPRRIEKAIYKARAYDYQQIEKIKKNIIFNKRCELLEEFFNQQL